MDDGRSKARSIYRWSIARLNSALLLFSARIEPRFLPQPDDVSDVPGVTRRGTWPRSICLSGSRLGVSLDAMMTLLAIALYVCGGILATALLAAWFVARAEGERLKRAGSGRGAARK